MTSKEKLLEKFLQTPASIKYLQIEKLLLFFGFTKIESKGSHKKFKHNKLEKDIIIPVHNNDCKDFYKKQTAKILKQLI